MSLLSKIDFQTVTAWFARQGRIYPWSLTKDPYEIWIAEIMLQQTTIQTVIGRYERWLIRWPTVAALAGADENQVLREWEGLGYYSRGSALLKAARVITQLGEFPRDEKALLKLPGVGPYTAAALASFAFGIPALTLDANLKRVFQRLANEALWTKLFEAEVRQVAMQAMTQVKSRDFNLGLMQLGQLVCRPRKPDCETCPLAEVCSAHLGGRPETIPQRSPKIIENQRTTIGVLWRQTSDYQTEFFVAHPLKGRFSNLWAFPPTSEPLPTAAIPLTPRLHTYTRYRDLLLPFLIKQTVAPPLVATWIGQWVTLFMLENEGMPSVHRLILHEALEKLVKHFSIAQE